MEATDFEIRAVRPDDLDFVYSTWLRNYRHSSDFAKRITATVFFRLHHLVLERILGRPSTRVMVACLRDDPQVILGYGVAEIQEPAPILHFVYVKKSWRGEGLAQKLFESLGLDRNKALVFTHWTTPVGDLLKKAPLAVYNPYLI